MSNDYTKYPKADDRQHTGLGTPPEPTLHQINTSAIPGGVSASEGNNHAENHRNRETASSEGDVYLSGGRGRVWGLFCSPERISDAGLDAGGKESELHSYPYQSRLGSISDRSSLNPTPSASVAATIALIVTFAMSLGAFIGLVLAVTR